MRRIFLLTLLAALSVAGSFAQSKVFNQITGAIRADLSEITQNRKVVGYLRLVQLEKSDKTTYNYEMQIMDENLNDISTAKFSDEYLDLNDVAFEGDRLCVSFITYSKVTAYTKITNGWKLFFVNLQGDIVKKQTLDNKPMSSTVTRNLPGVGFLFHNKGKEYSLVAYDTAGKRIWQKTLDREAYAIGATPKMVSYYDAKTKSLNFMNSSDGKNFFSKDLEAPKNISHALPGIQVYEDTIYYSGTLNKNSTADISFKEIKQGNQKGLITVKAWAPNKQSIKVSRQLWKDNLADITPAGGNPENKKEIYQFENAVTTKDGTTYFHATNVQTKVKVGNVVGTVVTMPLLVPPILFIASGYHKFYVTDATVFKISPANKFSRVTTLTQKRSGKFHPATPFYYSVNSSRNIVDDEGANAYFIGSDADNYSITNLITKKTKYIPKSSGSISSYIYPAKEGHFMLLEKNSATRSSKLSVVPL